MTAAELAAALLAREEMPPEQGERGEKGDPGRDGDVGLQGIEGPMGPMGIDGPAGRDGKDGADGKDGKRGPKGEKGDDGPEGPAGKDGAAAGFVGGRGGFPRGLNSGMVIDDEGTRLNSGTVLGEIDFAGAGVTVTQSGAKALVTIPGGGGGAGTLAATLALGNDGNALGIVNPGTIAIPIGAGQNLVLTGADTGVVTGASVTFTDADPTGDVIGGEVVIRAGGNTDEATGSYLQLNAGSEDGGGGGFVLKGGAAIAVDQPGGNAALYGGEGGGVFSPAYIFANGATPSTHGYAEIRTGGDDGGPGQLFSQDANGAKWMTVADALVAGGGQAAFVEPTTATPEQIVNALIAAGLMAAA